MQKNIVEKYEKRILIFVILIFIAIQGLIVTLMEVEQFSDSAVYFKSAQNAIEAGKLYPLENDLTNSVIVAPGWVNLIALLIVFGSIKSILYCNIILNTIILGELYYISQISVESAIICLTLFCITSVKLWNYLIPFN